MKIRNGFVSNSSSSSFMIARSALTEVQIEYIKNHTCKGPEYDIPRELCDPGDAWAIYESEYAVFGETSMANFPMDEFLFKIGVPSSAMRFCERF